MAPRSRWSYGPNVAKCPSLSRAPGKPQDPLVHTGLCAGVSPSDSGEIAVSSSLTPDLSSLNGDRALVMAVRVPDPNHYTMRAGDRSLGPGFHQFKREFDKEMEGRGESKHLLERQDICAPTMQVSSDSWVLGKFKSLIKAQSHGLLFSSGQSSCFDPTADLSLGPPVCALP